MIQNKAIKIINHQPPYSKIENIATDVEELYQRFDKLNKNYYKKAISTSSELILDLINDYIQYSEGNIMRNTSTFEKTKKKIKLFKFFIKEKVCYL